MGKKQVFGILLIAITLFVRQPRLFGAEPSKQVPLNGVRFNFKNAPSTRPATYDYRTITFAEGKSQTYSYGVLTTTSDFEKNIWTLHDVVTVAPKNPAYETPMNFSMVFDRKSTFSARSLLIPDQITINLTETTQSGRGCVRIFDFRNGVAKIFNEDGSKETQTLDFSRGILSFNALLRLTPLLPQTVGEVFTFHQYAEEFLYRIHTAEKRDAAFTLRCDSLETLNIGDQPHQCVKFVLELKSEVIRTEIWVDQATNRVIRFTDTVPGGGKEPDFLEATLRE